MKIEINEQHQFVLKEVSNSIILETAEGNRFAICMRDNTIEVNVMGFDDWYRANTSSGKIERLKGLKHFFSFLFSDFHED